MDHHSMAGHTSNHNKAWHLSLVYTCPFIMRLFPTLHLLQSWDHSRYRVHSTVSSHSNWGPQANGPHQAHRHTLPGLDEAMSFSSINYYHSVTSARHNHFACSTTIFLSLSDLFTHFIHTGSGLPLRLAPHIFNFITPFTRLLSSILSAIPNHSNTLNTTISFRTPALLVSFSILTQFLHVTPHICIPQTLCFHYI